MSIAIRTRIGITNRLFKGVVVNMYMKTEYNNVTIIVLEKDSGKRKVNENQFCPYGVHSSDNTHGT